MARVVRADADEGISWQFLVSRKQETACSLGSILYCNPNFDLNKTAGEEDPRKHPPPGNTKGGNRDLGPSMARRT